MRNVPEPRVLTPSVTVIASIRHAAPVEIPPDELVAFVRPVHAGDRLDDWELTHDAIAFGDVSVPQLYEVWRSSWARAWELDPVSSVERLVRVAESAGDRGSAAVPLLLGPVVDALADGRPAALDPEEMATLAPAVGALRDAIRAMGRTGFGFVDATRPATGAGLARAWSPASGEELLAGDHHVEVWMHPDDGLVVQLGTGERLRGVSMVEVADAHLDLYHGGGGAGSAVTRVELDEARPLAWIVPQATRWRVVEVPEVLVWARSIAGLQACHESAAALDRPVTFAVGATGGSPAPDGS